MKDLFNSITPKRVLSPSAGPSDNTAQVGQIIDHQGYESVTYVIGAGSLADADATFAVLLEEGNLADGSDMAAVADADMLGSELLASFTFADDNKMFKLGYIGSKRRTRMTITPAGNASAAALDVHCILGHPMIAPTANPPA